MSVVSGDHRRTLVRQARRLSRWVGVPVDLRFVDDVEMTELCQAHLGERKTTDVLSFEAEPPLPGVDDVSCGQIVLNADAIGRQAPRPDTWAWLSEASSLLVHGAAHLAGHDHGTRSEARAMLRLERRLARRLGLTWLPRPYGNLG